MASKVSILAVASLTPRQREKYEQVLHAIYLMRKYRMSLLAAAREAGTTVETVQRYARSALKRAHGRWVVKPHDRLERLPFLYDRKGSYQLTVGSSEAASRIRQYHGAVEKAVVDGDHSALRPFAGGYVVDVDGRRHYFITDRATIRRLARSGQLRFEGIY